MTEGFRFHLNVFCVNTTTGSIMMAVTRAKIIGTDTGSIKIAINNRMRKTNAYFKYSFLKIFKTNFTLLSRSFSKYRQYLDF